MAAFISENTVFPDVAGKPIVNGKIYIGQVLSDPKASLIDIFADRELQTPLSNPQLTDSFGRSLNKIWMPGRHSVLVENSNGVQKHIDLDAGSTPQSGVTTLSNIQFADDIIAEASITITGLVNAEIYAFKAIANNTGPVTLSIDGISAKSVVKYGATPLVADDIIGNENVFVEYNSSSDTFNMISTLPLLSQGTEGQVLTSTGNDAVWGGGVPTGFITAWPEPNGVLPVGYLECNGSTLSSTEFPGLFAVIGEAYGGGGGNFILPDLRGEFIRGFDNDEGNDPDAVSRANRGDGTTGNNVGTKQSFAIENITGSFTANNQRGLFVTTAGAFTTSGTLRVVVAASEGALEIPETTDFDASNVVQASTETRPRNVYMMYIIKT